MADFPLFTRPTITSNTFVSAGLATGIQVQLSLVQQRLKEAAFTFSSMASFLRVGQNTNGYISNIYHSNLGVGASADSHHARGHGTHHAVGGGDAIQSASAAAYGLISAGGYSKVNSFDSSSSRNNVVGSNYVGTGTTATRVVTIGWQPDYHRIFDEGSTGHSWEWNRGALLLNKHIYFSNHVFPLASNFITTHANGFQVKSSCNRAGIKYYFWACREV